VLRQLHRRVRLVDHGCPHCGSKEVEQCWSAFTAIKSKKSACELSPSTAPKAVIDTGPLRA